MVKVVGWENLPGELDVIEDNERSFDVKHGAVVHTGCNVVVSHGGAGVNDVVSHFTRIVCCFSCKLLKSASDKKRGGGYRVSDSVLQSSNAYL